MVLGHEARGHRARDGQRPQQRAGADRRRARLTAGEHDRGDREALRHLVQEDRDRDERAERRPDHEAGGDRDAIEERVDAEPEERQVTGRGREQRLGVHLLAEVEVRRHRVLEEVDAEVADEHEEERVRHVRALRQHPDECGGEHEARAGGDEVAERGPPAPVRGDDEQRAGDVRGGGGRERQVC